jgi:drug/metabolite transporter (DMT)-like permease
VDGRDVIEVSYIGYAAGLATSLLWAGTSLLFTAAVKRIGPTPVNTFRIVLAMALHALVYRAISGHWVPEARSVQVVALAVSGFLGLVVGDQALLSALVEIGPRLASLLMTAAPLWAALFGWAALSENLPAASWMGIGLTVAGTAWVILERTPSSESSRQGRWGRGVLYGLLAAVCQAVGLLLSKYAMGHGGLTSEQHMTPQTATFLRLFFASLGMMPLIGLHRLRRRNVHGSMHGSRPKGWLGVGRLYAAIGAVTGPFLGVWLSLIAADRIALGVAQALSSLTPVFILPLSVWVLKERISRRAVLGALAAVGGLFLLFLGRP